MDVVDLRNFYAQQLGVVARRFVSRGIRVRLKDAHGLRILGIGYATPYLGLFRGEAERCLALMPAPQGVVRWPSTRPALVPARGGSLGANRRHAVRPVRGRSYRRGDQAGLSAHPGAARKTKACSGSQAGARACAVADMITPVP